ncbi:UDP-3-O-(3-hydroxymyristoyl)glucosamine N-acyltransferase [Ideonella sp. 4Y11]|uniref:UDP-3-O-acylglucosamine N-acyltransferase n=1 Tax=Ideonella aquatica TaxID=2824119 RepID=A0A941BK44_9BURK|nr:UDP-3-O-(3-hydroxymyristoyl)glucosamine N-acyltransferase [Ideonella aquatica]MBQ0959533.1 UDP-3-O-(3-hydroxymyristoyl)glucosamine N-acyltransferase [Ideonella aquatica]
MTATSGALPTLRLADIVGDLGGELHGDGECRIARIASLETAGPGDLSFVAQARLRPLLERSQAGALVVREDLREAALARGAAVIVTADPYLYYARLTRWFAARLRPTAVPGVHPSAVIGRGVELHPSAHVGAQAVVEEGARIAAGAVIGPQCLVGADAVVGEGTRLIARVHFGAACVIGARGTLQPGAVVGSDGFGFAPHQGRWEKIEQLGSVVIGDDVDIGANTCIDRGALDDTVLADGVKLDNLIQIAHNVRIGAHTAMAGCVGVAGSARIGAHCTFGGAAMVLGHLEIVDHVHVSAGSFVMSSLTKPGQYSGVFPIDDNASWEKNAATLRQLHTLRSRLRALEKKIEP